MKKTKKKQANMERSGQKYNEVSSPYRELLLPASTSINGNLYTTARKTAVTF